LLLAEEPGDEGTEREPMRVVALTRVVAVGDPVPVLDRDGRLLPERLDRRAHVVDAAVLAEEHLEKRLGLEARTGARRREPARELGPPGLGDRVHGAPASAGPFLA